MQVNEINQKIQEKIKELEKFSVKFRTEKELIEQSNGSAARIIQIKAYITRLDLELQFLHEILVDIDSIEVGTINGDDSYAEDMEGVEEDELDGEEDDEESGSSY